MESLAGDRTHRLKVGRDGITGWVAATGEPSLVADVQRDPRYVSFTGDAQTRSELAVPIRLGGRGDRRARRAERAGGRLRRARRSSRQQTVADQLAVAIGNSRLYRSVRQQAERLAAVNRVSAAVGAVLDLDTLLETVRREVTAVFQADAFFVALYDQRTDELDFRIQVDEGVREPPTREKVGAGFTSRVIREKRPLLVRDVAAELAGLPEPLLYGTGKMPRSWLGAPMVVGEELVGVVSVQTYGERLYGEEDRLLLATIADQVAVAIENARLYEGAREELAERRRTERVLRESEQQFRSLAEQSPNMIFIYGSRRFLYANPHCETMMGWPREETCSPLFSWRRDDRARVPRCRGRALPRAARPAGDRAARGGARRARRPALRVHPHHVADPVRGPPRGARDRHGHHRAQARRAVPADPQRGLARDAAVADPRRDLPHHAERAREPRPVRRPCSSPTARASGSRRSHLAAAGGTAVAAGPRSARPLRGRPARARAGAARRGDPVRGSRRARSSPRWRSALAARAGARPGARTARRGGRPGRLRPAARRGRGLRRPGRRARATSPRTRPRRR